MTPDTPVLRRVLGLARPYRGWLLAALAIAAVTVLASVALMAVAGWFIAAMAIAGLTSGMMNYFLPAAAIRLLAIVRTGGRYLDRLISHEATFRLLAGLRLWLFRRLEPLAPADLGDQRGADLAGRLQADVDTLQHAFLRLASPLAAAALCSLAIVAGLALLHPPTAVAVAALLLAAGVAVPLVVRRRAAGAGDELVARRGALRVALVDFVQGLADLQAAGAVERRLAALSELSDTVVEAQRRAAAIGAVAETAVGTSAGLALWSATLLPLTSIAAGELDPALGPALALAALAAFEAVAPLPAALQRRGEIAAASRRLFVLADRLPSVVDGPAESPLPRDGSLLFAGVRLRYAGRSAPALDGLDLAVADGERVAILGASGAGKSSIARLLLRFWEYEGTIRLGGHDLRAYRGEDLRRLVGLAPQDAHLLTGSIRDNLLMAAPQADEAALRRALATAQLDPFVAALPDGLDTWVGEGGARLSAGEARRLVLARTLLREPRIVILDEPTENLDAMTARALLAALAAATAGRTVLLITHDPVAAAGFADRIVHLENGRLVA